LDFKKEVFLAFIPLKEKIVCEQETKTSAYVEGDWFII